MIIFLFIYQQLILIILFEKMTRHCTSLKCLLVLFVFGLLNKGNYAQMLKLSEGKFNILILIYIYPILTISSKFWSF